MGIKPVPLKRKLNREDLERVGKLAVEVAAVAREALMECAEADPNLMWVMPDCTVKAVEAPGEVPHVQLVLEAKLFPVEKADGE